jgi:hypothetical protein
LRPQTAALAPDSSARAGRPGWGQGPLCGARRPQAHYPPPKPLAGGGTVSARPPMAPQRLTPRPSSRAGKDPAAQPLTAAAGPSTPSPLLGGGPDGGRADRERHAFGSASRPPTPAPGRRERDARQRRHPRSSSASRAATNRDLADPAAPLPGRYTRSSGRWLRAGCSRRNDRLARINRLCETCHTGTFCIFFQKNCCVMPGARLSFSPQDARALRFCSFW